MLTMVNTHSTKHFKNHKMDVRNYQLRHRRRVVLWWLPLLTLKSWWKNLFKEMLHKNSPNTVSRSRWHQLYIKRETNWVSRVTWMKISQLSHITQVYQRKWICMQHSKKKSTSEDLFLVLQVVINRGLYSVPGRTK